jgi:tetratricopeptide (TPR) repeat protein
MRIFKSFSIYSFSLILLSLVLKGELLFANNHQEQFEAGLAAFQEERYDTAVFLFESSLSGDLKSSEAYNNLGMAYYKKEALGYAILNFERAIRQNSSNSLARNNLKAANQRLGTNVIPVKGYWLFKIWDNVSTSFSSWTWARLLWFFLFAAGAGFIVWRYTDQQKLQYWGIRGGAIALLFALFSMLLGFQASSSEFDSKWCIIVNKEAGIRTAPSVDGEDIMVVSAGIKAQITEEKEGWFRIRLDNGVLGWLPNNMAQRI